PYQSRRGRAGALHQPGAKSTGVARGIAVRSAPNPLSGGFSALRRAGQRRQAGGRRRRRRRSARRSRPPPPPGRDGSGAVHGPPPPSSAQPSVAVTATLGSGSSLSPGPPVLPSGTGRVVRAGKSSDPDPNEVALHRGRPERGRSAPGGQGGGTAPPR